MENPAFPPEDVVERAFLETRGKLIEVAAFLDRAERHGRADDFRVQALKQALKVISENSNDPDRTARMLLALSDPTSDPIPKATTQGAAGAWKPPAG